MNPKTHRHYVALPLLVLAMQALSGWNSMLEPQAASLAHASGKAGWILASRAEPGTELRTFNGGETAELIRGQVLLGTAGNIVLRADNLFVHAFDASFVALRDDSSVTIAALRDPLILQQGDTTSVLQPGMQAVSHGGEPALSYLPADWLAERIAEEKLLTHLPIPRPDTSVRAELAHLFVDETVPAAADILRTRELAREIDASGAAERLAFFHILVESKLEGDAESVLSDWMTDDPFLRSPMLALLPSTVSLSKKPVSAIAIQLWQKEALSQALSDSSAVAALLHRFAALPSEMERAGYPKQAAYWRDALIAVTDLLRATSAETATLENDRSLIEQGIQPASSATSNIETAQTRPTTQWSGKELQMLAWQLLVEHEVLLTQVTAYTSDVETQTVHVGGVFLPENGRDVPYEFTIDLAANRVTDIVRDGAKLPNAVPVEQFFR